jgi:nucleotide-binding universal stress UspA family protein
MISLSHILFPVDLSETSHLLARYVRALAEQLEASVHLLTVVRDFSYFASLSVTDNLISSVTQDVITATIERLSDFRDIHFSGFEEVKFFVVYGNIPDRILEYATVQKSDVIVMATHGRKGIERIPFGSVTDRVVKTSKIPVLTVNPYRMSRQMHEREQGTRERLGG